MANFIYNTALGEIIAGTIDLVADTIKVIPVTSTYVANRDDDVADAGGASDVVDAEIVATNYTGGWGGAGRKTLASKTLTVDKTNDRVEFNCAAFSWTALGGATNATIAAYVVVKEGGANDTTTRLIAYIDTLASGTLPLTTNGSDLTVTPNAEGLLQFPTA
jgi:hypothetical protein